MKRPLCAIAILYVFHASQAFAVKADDILGFWVTAGGNSRVEISKGSNSYSGKITAIREPNFLPGEVNGMDGSLRVDINNPDKSLRRRSLVGLELMTGFSFNGEEWIDGKTYDPESGKTYKCKMSIAEDGSLYVRGYIGVSLLGRTTVWQRDEVYIKSFCKTLTMLGVRCIK